MAPAPALAHRILGENGPWVVVLHGLLGSSSNWQAVARSRAADHRLCLVDLRNHGASFWASSMTYEEMTADVCTLLDGLGIETASFVGHSMGGKIAMWTALTRPDRVSRLAVIDIAPVAYDHDHADSVEAMRTLDLRGLPSRGAADEQLSGVIADDGLRGFLLQNLVREHGSYRWRANLDSIANAMPDLAGFPSTAARFEGPALTVAGSRSGYVDAVGRAALADRFPELVIETIEGAGHWPHVERPNEVASLLERFLMKGWTSVHG